MSRTPASSNSRTPPGGPPRTPTRAPRTPVSSAARTPTRTPAANARVSVKDQIAALRAAQKNHTPIASPTGADVRKLIHAAADSGRLVLPTTIQPPLRHLPISLFTLLLGIPPNELTRKPAKPTTLFPGSSSTGADGQLARGLGGLSLDGDTDNPFGNNTPRPAEDDVEYTGGFLASADLEVLKAGNQALESLDLELALFGALKSIDFRHNALTTIPATIPNLRCLTVLNLSHNQLASFPPPLTLLPALLDLDLSFNFIEELSFEMPEQGTAIIPASPPSSFSSPQAPAPILERPLPKLKTLNLDGNKLSIKGLPQEWPPAIVTLHLAENPLLSSGRFDELSLSPFVSIDSLRRLYLGSAGIRTISQDGRSALGPRLELLSLVANQWLEQPSLADGWGGAKEVVFAPGETGEEDPSVLKIILDPHQVPKKSAPTRRHILDPSVGSAPSSPAVDPFAPKAVTSRRAAAQQQVPKKPNVFDDWEVPASSSASAASFQRAVACPREENSTKAARNDSGSSPSSSSSGDSSGLFDAYHRSGSFALNLPKVPPPAFSTGTVSLPDLASQPWSTTLTALFLSGPSLKTLILPSSPDDHCLFPTVTHLAITATPASLSSLVPLLPVLFPQLERLDLSESRLGDALLSSTFLDSALETLLLRENGGRLKSLMVRESGVKSLAGLEAIARRMQEEGEQGAVRRRWQLEELDLSDCLVEKLDPILSVLPLKLLSVDRNLFRTPRAAVWEKEGGGQRGTQALLTWLRDRL